MQYIFAVICAVDKDVSEGQCYLHGLSATTQYTVQSSKKSEGADGADAMPI